MESNHAKPNLISVANVATTLIFLTALAGSGLAQQGSSNPGLSPNAETRVRAEHQTEMDIQREALLKGSNSTAKPIDRKQLQALTAQLKEDFERLWNISSELMDTLSHFPNQKVIKRVKVILLPRIARNLRTCFRNSMEG